MNDVGDRSGGGSEGGVTTTMKKVVYLVAGGVEGVKRKGSGGWVVRVEDAAVEIVKEKKRRRVRVYGGWSKDPVMDGGCVDFR